MSSRNKELLEENQTLYEKVKHAMQKTKSEKHNTTTYYTKIMDKERIKHAKGSLVYSLCVFYNFVL